MKFIFWFAFFFILYTYIGYLLLLYIWAKLFPKKINKSCFSKEPTVSVIIAARNEEKHIERRIENLLDQQYSKEKMEIIIVSDGSIDATNDMVSRYCNELITLKQPDSGKPRTCHLKDFKFFKYKQSRGKSSALNLGLQNASGDIIVFADARQWFERNAIKELVANFNDASVGSVSGELVFLKDSQSDFKVEMGIYWTIEKRIRKLESSIGSVAGATGAIYAIRKSLFKSLPAKVLIDDVLTPMNIVFQGYRNVFDEQAVAYDSFSENFQSEKSRKIRTLVGNWQLLQILPQLLSPFANPIFFRFLSHKIFRLLVPFFLIILLASSFLIKGWVYKTVFSCIVITITLSLFSKALVPVPIFNKASGIANVFISLNYFAFLAFFKFFFPGRKNIW